MIEEAIKNLNINALNEMQHRMLKAIETRKDEDIVLLSPTGSGKTLGFLLPLLKIMQKNTKGVQAMVIVPSRELAIQIEQVFKGMKTSFKVNSCYGGHDTKTERNNFIDPPDLLVGTPGRIMYHINRDSFDTSTVKTLILDEFDKSLEFGFQNEMEFIIQELPKLNKRILTSATPGAEIPEFAGLKSPHTISFLKDHISPQLTLKYVRSEGHDKLQSLMALISKAGNAPTLVFCNHRDAVDRISDLLSKNKVYHDVYHGKLEQDQRELALIKFRNGSHNLLITTDLASRGLDIPAIQYVIHYQLPLTEDAFIHRNGRTARMHAEGTAYLILGEDERLPDFIKNKLPEEKLSEHFNLPTSSEWCTLYIAAGKKDKVNKIDIVGFLIQKGGLQKEELGKIEVLDYMAYAAVKRSKANNVVAAVRNEKLKNKSLRIGIQQ